MLRWIFDTLVGGAAYDLFKHYAEYALGSLIMAILGTTVLRYAFHKLQERREQIFFFCGTFLACVVLFVSIGSGPQQPNLVGSVQQVTTGQNAVSDRDTYAVFTVGIVNTGSMQSIIKQWRVQAKAQGNTYEGVIMPMQRDFTFSNIPRISEDQPESVTYKAQDDIVQKGLFPIQTGAFLQGLIVVIFKNVDPTVFKGSVEYEVSYEDALSNKYTMPIKYNGQMGNFPLVPGLHTEAVCRTASWQPPPPDVTGSISTPAAPSTGVPQLNFTPIQRPH